MSDKHYFNYKVGEFVVNSKHPDKLYWPDANITKRDLMDYYDKVGGYMLNFLQERPLTLHYYIYGINGFSFYKRDFDSKAPEEFIKTYTYKEQVQDKVMHVPVILNKASLVYLASRGCLEIHAWSAKYPHFEHPDLAIFDLDIAQNTDFSKVIETANLLHQKLLQKNIKSYPKTSGGTGLHVYIPISPVYTYEQVRTWVKNIGEELAKENPKLITTIKEQRKSHSGDRVVVDFLQNAVTRNTAAPYTPRANKEAKVSTPLYWEEVEKGNFLPEDFTIKTIQNRLDKIGNPFKDILANPQAILS